MSNLGLVVWVVMPLIGFAFAAHRFWRYRTTERVTASFVTVARPLRKNGADQRPTVAFTYEGRVMQIQLAQALSAKASTKDAKLRLYFPRKQPERARIWDLRTLWLVLAFAFGPAFALTLLTADFWISKYLHDRVFDPGAMHYIAATADWKLRQLFGLALFAILGLILLWRAIRRHAKVFEAISQGLVGTALLGLALYVLGQDWQSTQRCIAPENIAQAQRMSGVIEFAREAKNIKGRNTGYYEIKLNDRIYQSAGFGKASECGFKASLAQSMPLRANMKVEVAALGDVIIELRVLP